MSFKFEDIDDEIYMKLAEKAGGKDYIWVTPKELPPNFPLVDQSPQACCLSYRFVLDINANFIFKNIWISQNSC